MIGVTKKLFWFMVILIIAPFIRSSHQKLGASELFPEYSTHYNETRPQMEARHQQEAAVLQQKIEAAGSYHLLSSPREASKAGQKLGQEMNDMNDRHRSELGTLEPNSRHLTPQYQQSNLENLNSEQLTKKSQQTVQKPTGLAKDRVNLSKPLEIIKRWYKEAKQSIIDQYQKAKRHITYHEDFKDLYNRYRTNIKNLKARKASIQELAQEKNKYEQAKKQLHNDIQTVQSTRKSQQQKIKEANSHYAQELKTINQNEQKALKEAQQHYAQNRQQQLGHLSLQEAMNIKINQLDDPYTKQVRDIKKQFDQERDTLQQNYESYVQQIEKDHPVHVIPNPNNLLPLITQSTGEAIHKQNYEDPLFKNAPLAGSINSPVDEPQENHHELLHRVNLATGEVHDNDLDNTLSTDHTIHHDDDLDI